MQGCSGTYSTLRSKRLIVHTLTFGRVPLIFVFLALAIFHVYYPCHSWLAVAATAAMALSGFTDLLDGMLARRWKVTSRLGALADPLMDKVFYLVVFPALLWLLGQMQDEKGHALWMLIFTILYILRDQWVTFLRSVGAMYQADCRASWSGKVRTAVGFPASCVIYVYASLQPWFLPQGIILALEIALILITLWSIVTYTHDYLPYLRRAIRE